MTEMDKLIAWRDELPKERWFRIYSPWAPTDEGLGGDAEYFQVSVQEGKGCYAPYGCGISVSFDVAIRTAMKNFAKDVIAAPIRKAEMDAYDKENEEAERKAGQA